MPVAPRFRLRCWGARGTIPSPGPQALRYGGNTSCIEIAPANGPRIIMDAGSGIRALGAHIMQERGANSKAENEDDVIHLFLTHQHFDHVVGLPHFQPLRSENSRIVMRCGNATQEELRDLVDNVLAPPLFVEMPMLIDTLAIESCDAGVPMAVGEGCTVTRVDARHNGGAAIFRVNDSLGPAIAFAPDNELSYASTESDVIAWRTRAIEELRGVPVLLHDAMYSEAELPQYAGWGHSSAEEATRFALECGAQRLLLFHHHPDRTDIDVDDLVWTCRSMAHRAGSKLQIDAAYEGMVVTI